MHIFLLVELDSQCTSSSIGTERWGIKSFLVPLQSPWYMSRLVYWDQHHLLNKASIKLSDVPGARLSAPSDKEIDNEKLAGWHLRGGEHSSPSCWCCHFLLKKTPAGRNKQSLRRIFHFLWIYLFYTTGLEDQGSCFLPFDVLIICKIVMCGLIHHRNCVFYINLRFQLH